MLYIDWYQQDWLKWLPMFLGGIVALILVIRVLRRLTRWTSIKVSHVSQQSLEYDGMGIPVYQRTLSPSDPQIQGNGPKSILLIPPRSAKNQKNYHFAVGLASAGLKIFVLTPQHIKKWLNSNDFSQKLTTFCQQHNISHGIFFDYITPIMLLHISHTESIQWTVIRPQIHENWFLRQFKHTLSQNKYNFELIALYQPKKNTIFIEPSYTWLSPSSKKNWNEFKIKIQGSYPNNWITFKSGGWSFIGQETVLFGYILGIITTKSI